MVMLLKPSLSFVILGLLWGVALEVDARITRAARVFGSLQRPVFCDDSLSLMTKRMVYQAMVLRVLLLQWRLGLLSREMCAP